MTTQSLLCQELLPLHKDSTKTPLRVGRAVGQRALPVRAIEVTPPDTELAIDAALQSA